MNDTVYSAFEERYRCSRDVTKSRLLAHLPLTQLLLESYTSGKALDLGCGRGEWLELMTEQGFDATGVDFDTGMLEASKALGLKVEGADAVAYMQVLASETLVVLSGFHIAEHLPFEKFQQLVQEALRVLVPGGLLIFETHNPENISVGSNSFYLDPTHERPLPSQLLRFLPERYVFFGLRFFAYPQNTYPLFFGLGKNVVFERAIGKTSHENI